ncbi:MAG: high-affinity nickel-transporter [Herpetosiphonaceae bacterium]|nr:high-affinity nickel-transporter [Herpetosiphonaceae bacterium]
MGRYVRCLHRWLLPITGLLMLWGLIQPPTVGAHPLGNFTINLYSRLEPGAGRITIVYVVDMAEIPTFQEFGAGIPTTATQMTYLSGKAAALLDGLQLMIDQRPATLTITDRALRFLPGQGGLLTTRVELQLATLTGTLTGNGQQALSYNDHNFAGRLGWHEIVLRPQPGLRVLRSDASTVDQSNELRTYPQDMLTSPLDVRAAQAVVAPGSGVMPLAVPVASIGAFRASDRFAALITTTQWSPSVLLLALLLSMGLGAMHALAPGHGKTIVGAYLVGARGTARHAVFLGITVTTTHTLGVFVLGLLTLYASRYVLPEQLYPWLSVLSGALVVIMGLSLLRQRLAAVWPGRTARVTPDHEHESNDLQSYGHVHGPNTHTHLPPRANSGSLTWRNLLALGISGGLLPCPSALVVMLGAIALGRIGLGLLLIIAFSIGLAGVLTGIGLLFVHGGRWLGRLAGGSTLLRWQLGLRLLPIGSALVVTAAGVLITLEAVFQAGVIR